MLKNAAVINLLLKELLLIKPQKEEDELSELTEELMVNQIYKNKLILQVIAMLKFLLNKREKMLKKKKKFKNQK